MLTETLANRYRGLLFWLGGQDWFNWLGPRLFAPLDKWLYPRVHGAIVSAGPPVLPLLMLTTKGRASGRQRTVPLLYMQRGDELIVVGSNWARAHHPGWSENLLVHPGCSVTIGRWTEHAHARLLAVHEAEALWPRLEAFCPVWRSYRHRSGRELRIFALLCDAAGSRSASRHPDFAELGVALDQDHLNQT